MMLSRTLLSAAGTNADLSVPFTDPSFQVAANRSKKVPSSPPPARCYMSEPRLSAATSRSTARSIDLADAEARLNGGVRAIIPVHLNGSEV
jgi:hypothetical protein